MVADKHSKRHYINEFITWVNETYGESYPTALVDAYIDSLVDCDSAVAYGKGHQSIGYCVRTGEHSEHIENHYDIEWTDSDIKSEYVPRHGKKAGQTFRLAYNDYGWY